MTAKEACTFEEIRAYGSSSCGRLFTDAAGYWGQRARAHMAAGFPEMAYETAYTAAHCGQLALAIRAEHAEDVRFTLDDIQEQTPETRTTVNTDTYYGDGED